MSQIIRAAIRARSRGPVSSATIQAGCANADLTISSDIPYYSGGVNPARYDTTVSPSPSTSEKGTDGE